MRSEYLVDLRLMCEVGHHNGLQVSSIVEDDQRSALLLRRLLQVNHSGRRPPIDYPNSSGTGL